jgi:hypothetical protein
MWSSWAGTERVLNIPTDAATGVLRLLLGRLAGADGGADLSGVFALIARPTWRSTGTTEEQMAHVAVKKPPSRRAQSQGPVPQGDHPRDRVSRAPRSPDPLKLFRLLPLHRRWGGSRDRFRDVGLAPEREDSGPRARYGALSSHGRHRHRCSCTRKRDLLARAVMATERAAGRRLNREAGKTPGRRGRGRALHDCLHHRRKIVATERPRIFSEPGSGGVAAEKGWDEPAWAKLPVNSLRCAASMPIGPSPIGATGAASSRRSSPCSARRRRDSAPEWARLAAHGPHPHARGQHRPPWLVLPLRP